MRRLLQWLDEDPGCVQPWEPSWEGRFLHWTQTPPCPPGWALFWLQGQPAGEGVAHLSAEVPPCHPSSPPAQFILQTTSEIPCPAPSKDGTVSSAPSPALWNSWVIFLRKNKSARDKSHALSFSLCQAAERQSYKQTKPRALVWTAHNSLKLCLLPREILHTWDFGVGVCLLVCFVSIFLQQYPE